MLNHTTLEALNVPDVGDRAEAVTLRDLLEARDGALTITTGDGRQACVPRCLQRQLLELAARTAEGDAVVVDHVPAELDLTEAARVAGVARHQLAVAAETGDLAVVAGRVRTADLAAWRPDPPEVHAARVGFDG